MRDKVVLNLSSFKNMWMKEPPFYRSHENHRTFPHFSSKQKNNWIKAGSGKVLYSMAPLILSWVGRDPKVCRGDRIWARSRLVLFLRAPRAPIGSLRPLIFSDQSPAAYCLLFLLTFSAYFFRTLIPMASPYPASPMTISNKRRFPFKRKIVKVDPQVRF